MLFISAVIMVLQSNTLSLGKLEIKFLQIPWGNLLKFSFAIWGNFITNFPCTMVLLIISIEVTSPDLSCGGFPSNTYLKIIRKYACHKQTISEPCSTIVQFRILFYTAPASIVCKIFKNSIVFLMH